MIHEHDINKVSLTVSKFINKNYFEKRKKFSSLKVFRKNKDM